MQFQYEADLGYQLDAINAVADLFQGQELGNTVFTVLKPTSRDASRPELGFDMRETGYGNRLLLLPEDVLKNLKEVQGRNSLPRTGDTELAGMDFTVEMETGTGKTYVYLRTAFELFKRYGFSKFIIVVPSVAIREGVLKSLQTMATHFADLYDGTTADHYVYSGSDLGRVRTFATSPRIQIMVMTVGAINKQDTNIIYEKREQTNWEAPIDLISRTNPIVIVDEPQSVEGGLSGKGKEAIQKLKPLATLRYSATHRHAYYKVYRLDAVDAYDMKLVKQIEVAALEVQDAHNTAYVKLLKTSKSGSTYKAKLEVDKQGANGAVSRTEVTVGQYVDLSDVTGREIYRGYYVENIGSGAGNQWVAFRNLEHRLEKGASVGDVDRGALHEQMMRQTIVEHLDKELRLRPIGIKVLSLFFIDKVPLYRSYDAEGNLVPGPYAEAFERLYRECAALPRYRTLFQEVDLAAEASRVHDGYFSIDKRIHSPFEDKKAKSNANQDDIDGDTYNLIMRDKERLLDLRTPLKFIFSHSALREGWDNPNVFQICALREIATDNERRQTIGRGLRLCVDSNLERIRRPDVNILTVVANESYQDFAAKLQKQMEEETGIRFGIVEKHHFEKIGLPTNGDGTPGEELASRSAEVWQFLREQGMLGTDGKVQDVLRQALRDGTLELPAAFEPYRNGIEQVLRKIAGSLDMVRNKADRVPVATKRAVLDSPEFKELWDRIKHRTVYRVEFSEADLIKRCITAIKDMESIREPRLVVRKADIGIDRSGTSATESQVSAPLEFYHLSPPLPDILSVLQEKTRLTRKCLAEILVGSNRLDDLKRNPQRYMELAIEAISRTKQSMLVEGIRYEKVEELGCYAQELFESEELLGYMSRMVESTKSPHEYVLYDSGGIELNFAKELENNTSVKVYAKLPGWFKIPTPLGTYNPDWAILIERDGAHRLYFVAETKGSVWAADLRDAEEGKIRCGRAHFDALAQGQENPAKYMVATELGDVMREV